MTKEQYSRAVAINSRIAELKETLERIKNTKEHKLYYAYRNCSGDYTTCPDWAMRPISEILDKHDLAIRKEIQDEIDSLNKEIETL